jgi:hypothetical protein
MVGGEGKFEQSACRGVEGVNNTPYSSNELCFERLFPTNHVQAQHSFLHDSGGCVLKVQWCGPVCIDPCYVPRSVVRLITATPTHCTLGTATAITADCGDFALHVANKHWSGVNLGQSKDRRGTFSDN